MGKWKEKERELGIVCQTSPSFPGSPKLVPKLTTRKKYNYQTLLSPQAQWQIRELSGYVIICNLGGAQEKNTLEPVTLKTKNKSMTKQTDSY